jgi:hypothetical protein
MSVQRLAAFTIFLALCYPAVSSQTLNEERLSLRVPGAPWTLTLPKGDFVIQTQHLKPDGRSGYFSMNDERNKLTVSFFIEPVSDCKDSKACRNMVWKLGNPAWEKPQKVVEAEIGDVSYFEFFMPSFQGIPVKQQNMYVEFVRDGYWVDMHLSKILYKPEEHELFERVVKSVRFDPKNP